MGSRDCLKILPPLFIHEEDSLYAGDLLRFIMETKALYVCSPVQITYTATPPIVERRIKPTMLAKAPNIHVPDFL